MKDIVLFGMPGAGKGTQAAMLAANYGDSYRHFSSGDVFRALFSQPNPIGIYAKSRMDAGLLIDDKVTISIFNAYFRGVVDEGSQMLLDGYPRTLTQMDALFRILEDNHREIMGVYFELPEEEAIQRMLDRWREGETRDTIAIRMQEYYQKTLPIVESFSARAELVTLDALPDVDTIYQHFVSAVGLSTS